jgi:hypothetical protein
MEALRDAETGKAQHMKGDSLDVVVPQGVSEITLEDGVSAVVLLRYRLTDIVLLD